MDFIEQLRASTCVKTHKGASDAEIKDMLRINRVKLPEDYRRFLLSVGWVEVGTNVVYGLGPDATPAESILEHSQFEHVRASPLMHSALMPLMNDGAGNHYCLDTSKVKDGRCPIVFWEHDHPDGELQKPKRVKPNFERWIVDLVLAEEGIQ